MLNNKVTITGGADSIAALCSDNSQCIGKGNKDTPTTDQPRSLTRGFAMQYVAAHAG